VNDYAPSIAPIRQDAPDEIPIVDLSDYRAGAPGALSRISAELRHALQDVGFYFVINHGVPESLIAGAFDAARRFHDQPEETKLALRINQHNIGYLPFKSSVTRHSKLNDNNRPNLVEAFFTKRETPVDAQVQPFRAPNRWPDNLPGFRDAVLAYQICRSA
jgi:isopenicillin N synthase-like dioxygenase